jgi:hypothetical protein
MRLLSLTPLATVLTIQAALTPAQTAKRVGPAVVTIQTQTDAGSGGRWFESSHPDQYPRRQVVAG